ncbi:MAG TPA: redoxin family protein [Candidatus Eisenbacteria bacterium]|nr:redoxin family protein [Candidatus Eisenbacteria bacterium]
MKPEVEGLRLPEFPALEWLHSPALRAAQLKGRAVLVTFWDYASVHCLRVLPYLRAWNERYADLGLTVIAVHSPEFPFARDRERVIRATSELDIPYAVALDPDFLAWQAFHNQFWPSTYLFDATGALRYYHFGEGDYEACERAIQECLGEIHAHHDWPEILLPFRPEDRPGSDLLRATPQINLGIERGRIANASGARVGESGRLALPGRREPDAVYAEGAWRHELSYLESAEASPASLHVRYTAVEVSLVAQAPEGKTIEVEIGQDGAVLDVMDRGEDAIAAESGATYVSVSGPRLYRLVRNHVYATRDLRLSLDRAGLRVFALTFVSGAPPSAAADIRKSMS